MRIPNLANLVFACVLLIHGISLHVLYWRFSELDFMILHIVFAREEGFRGLFHNKIIGQFFIWWTNA